MDSNYSKFVSDKMVHLLALEFLMNNVIHRRLKILSVSTELIKLTKKFGKTVLIHYNIWDRLIWGLF